MTAKTRKRIYVLISVASFITGWLVNYHRLFIWEVAPNDALFLSQGVALVSALMARNTEKRERKK